MVERRSKTPPEGKKEMNDLMLELFNFMGRAVGRGLSNNGGRPVGLRCITAAPLALTVVFLASCATQDVTPSQQPLPILATGAVAAGKVTTGPGRGAFSDKR